MFVSHSPLNATSGRLTSTQAHMGTMQNQHLQQDPHTNHHFPSTHPRSPTHHNPQQQLAGPSRLHQQPTLGNDLSQDQMEMMGRVESPAGSHPTPNMARSPALNTTPPPPRISATTAATKTRRQPITRGEREQDGRERRRVRGTRYALYVCFFD